MNALERLKVGDEVVVGSGGLVGNRLARVAKITPTGRIVLDSGERANKHGHIGSGYYAFYIRKATEADRSAILLERRRRVLRMLLKKADALVSSMDMDTASAMVEALRVFPEMEAK